MTMLLVPLLHFIQEYVNEETMPRRDAATRLIVDSRPAETALHEQQQTMHFANEKKQARGQSATETILCPHFNLYT